MGSHDQLRAEQTSQPTRQTENSHCLQSNDEPRGAKVGRKEGKDNSAVKCTDKLRWLWWTVTCLTDAADAGLRGMNALLKAITFILDMWNSKIHSLYFKFPRERVKSSGVEISFQALTLTWNVIKQVLFYFWTLRITFRKKYINIVTHDGQHLLDTCIKRENSWRFSSPSLSTVQILLRLYAQRIANYCYNLKKKLFARAPN